MTARCISSPTSSVVVGIALALSIVSPAIADSSSPLLAAYYDRQMAIIGGNVYGWRRDDPPVKMRVKGVQVAVGHRRYYVLTPQGTVLVFKGPHIVPTKTLAGIVRFAAGLDGVLGIDRVGILWAKSRPQFQARRLAENVSTAAVGDGANYYVTKSGALFVRGAAHRGQYGNGQLTKSKTFVQTATNVAQISAHTGHAILLKKNGDVFGTGGNIYGPVGRHGFGDKAVRWSLILRGAKAIATGASHSLAIMRDGTLMAWGTGYGLTPVPVMKDVKAVAAGSYTTIALKTDDSLWQWDRGEKPRQIPLR
jgi:hypothetical protein